RSCKKAGVSGAVQAPRARRFGRPHRGGKAAAVRARRVSGHWPDRASSAAALMGLSETGTPGNARGVAREAETAPDTPAFLKNEKNLPRTP
ncbi:MAG TPA: hypothetical protein VL001_00190, partial [Candidimonas sp.]|nr:hypothetical protein [Candidimonas sp.]